MDQSLKTLKNDPLQEAIEALELASTDGGDLDRQTYLSALTSLRSYAAEMPAKPGDQKILRNDNPLESWSDVAQGHQQKIDAKPQGKLTVSRIPCVVRTEDGPESGQPSAAEIADGLTARDVIEGMISMAKQHKAFVDFTLEGVEQQVCWASKVDTILALHERQRDYRKLLATRSEEAVALGFSSEQKMDEAQASGALRAQQHSLAVAYQSSPEAEVRKQAAAVMVGICADQIAWVELPKNEITPGTIGLDTLAPGDIDAVKRVEEAFKTLDAAMDLLSEEETEQLIQWSQDHQNGPGGGLDAMQLVSMASQEFDAFMRGTKAARDSTT